MFTCLLQSDSAIKTEKKSREEKKKREGPHENPFVQKVCSCLASTRPSRSPSRTNHKSMIANYDRIHQPAPRTLYESIPNPPFLTSLKRHHLLFITNYRRTSTPPPLLFFFFPCRKRRTTGSMAANNTSSVLGRLDWERKGRGDGGVRVEKGVGSSARNGCRMENSKEASLCTLCITPFLPFLRARAMVLIAKKKQKKNKRGNPILHSPENSPACLSRSAILCTLILAG